MENYYKGDIHAPYHLSIGAAVVNDRGEVCCHYFNEIDGHKDFYILMRETLEMGETIDEALARGLMEEFGMVADPVTFLGALTIPVVWEGLTEKVEKTTLYFLCRFISQNEALRLADDPERASQIVWKTPDFLIPKMIEQAKRLNLTQVDESKILERVKVYLTLNVV